MSEPDRANNVALYTQLTAHFRARILNGTLPTGSRLPTEYELAEQFHISRGTVRQAMTTLVNEGLVERIQGRGSFVRSPLAAAPQPGIRPEAGKRIGVLLSYLISELDLKMLGGVEATARARGYQVNFAFTEESAEQQTRDIAWLRSDSILGMIIYPLSDISFDESIWRLQTDGFPFVLIDRYFPSLDTDYVTSDNIETGYRMAQHLIILGHTRIAFVYGLVGNLTTTSVRDRYAGFRRALNEYGLTADPSLVQSFSLASGDNALLTRADRPTAVCASTDGVAIELVHSAQRNGLRVPEDLAVVGIDNSRFTGEIHPALTTVAQPAREIATTAANLLINRIEGLGGAPQHIQLPTNLIIRESCGARLHIQRSVRQSGIIA